MIEITLSDAQSRVVAESSPPFLVVDSKGNAVGQITPVSSDMAKQPRISAEDWAEVKRRMQSPGQYFTFEQIKQRLGW
jgi:hypothetical protein